MEEYIYGLNYEDDLERLYGSSCKELNTIRITLFENFTPNVPEVKALRDIIQNPIPITLVQFKEWVSIKSKLIKEVGYYLCEKDRSILNEIGDFVYKYHVIEE